MKARDRDVANELERQLTHFSATVRALPGVDDPDQRHCFVRQLVESIHRVRYVAVIKNRDISPRRIDPHDELFDPIKAAVYHQRDGDTDEAFWCIFLFVHFGKHRRAGYRYAREVYGRIGQPGRWDWRTTSADPSAFTRWVAANESHIRRPGIPRGFGSHRHRESLAQTGTVVSSYVDWVAPHQTHEILMRNAIEKSKGDPHHAFSVLYESMTAVHRFGRLAKLDYLAMVGKLGLAQIEPGSAFLAGATGPLAGARLLFGVPASSGPRASTMDDWVVQLGNELGVGMQVMEDALCNWQKSAGEFRPFRG